MNGYFSNFITFKITAQRPGAARRPTLYAPHEIVI